VNDWVIILALHADTAHISNREREQQKLAVISIELCKERFTIFTTYANGAIVADTEQPPGCWPCQHEYQKIGNIPPSDISTHIY
jgi:hypothetical protein